MLVISSETETAAMIAPSKKVPASYIQKWGREVLTSSCRLRIFIWKNNILAHAKFFFNRREVSFIDLKKEVEYVSEYRHRTKQSV